MMILDWWMVGIIIGLVMFLAVLGSCLHDLSRKRGYWYEDELLHAEYRENTRK